MRRERVLFLCMHNSARSQMAESWLRALAGDRFEVASAGRKATRVHPLAVAFYAMWYNFARIHQTLRVTPAMEAGVSDHVWERGGNRAVGGLRRARTGSD